MNDAEIINLGIHCQFVNRNRRSSSWSLIYVWDVKSYSQRIFVLKDLSLSEVKFTPQPEVR